MTREEAEKMARDYQGCHDHYCTDAVCRDRVGALADLLLRVERQAEERVAKEAAEVLDKRAASRRIQAEGFEAAHDAGEEGFKLDRANICRLKEGEALACAEDVRSLMAGAGKGEQRLERPAADKGGGE